MELPVRSAEVTAALRTIESSHGASLDQLVEVLYDELKGMARRALAREAPGHTLQPTALVHEAYLKLVGATRIGRAERAYFFGAAGRAMRQVLIDHARRRTAGKRGAGAVHVTLDPEQTDVDAFAVELLDLDRALEELAAIRPRHAQVVECRYFGGLNVEETATVLQVSARTVKADWALARAWLYERLQGRAPDGADG